jgi:hypothetical protein
MRSSGFRAEIDHHTSEHSGHAAYWKQVFCDDNMLELCAIHNRDQFVVSNESRTRQCRPTLRNGCVACQNGAFCSILGRFSATTRNIW